MSPRPAHLRPSPFPVDPGAAARLASLVAAHGEALAAALRDAVASRDDRSCVDAAVVEALVALFALASPREAALLALPVAAGLARPAISDYHVGAVGVTDAGELVLGGNLEFPGASIHHTVHAEGFVTLRSRALRRPLTALAIRQARPCAHCRQVLAEMTWADGLRLVDPQGGDVGLWDVYPVAFTPADLDEAGCDPVHDAWPRLTVADAPEGIGDALARAGARAHVPYSREPAAVALVLADGRIMEGSPLESVAFNPSIGPLQDALVATAALGVPYADVRSAWLAAVPAARVDHGGPTRDLLAAVAPGAVLHARYWA